MCRNKNSRSCSSTLDIPVIALLLFDSLVAVFFKELFDTEVKFHHDMTVGGRAFMSELLPVVGTEAFQQLFLNWDQLLHVSASIATALKSQNPGVVLNEIEQCSLFFFFEHFNSATQYQGSKWTLSHYCCRVPYYIQLSYTLDTNN